MAASAYGYDHETKDSLRSGKPGFYETQCWEMEKFLNRQSGGSGVDASLRASH